MKDVDSVDEVGFAVTGEERNYLVDLGVGLIEPSTGHDFGELDR